MAPTLVNFTLRDNQFATASDSDDGGADSDVVSLIGPVKFIPQINRPALGTTLSPQAMLSLRTIDGYYDTDGQLKNKRGGSVGVRIPANDPVLGLARLPYKAVFGPMTTPPGDVVPLPDVTFDAPATDTTLWLPSVAPLPGATALGITKGDKGDPVDDVQSALSDTAAQFYVKGTPIGDPLVLPSAAWGSILGKPDFIAAGADAAAARAALGAAKRVTYLIDDFGTVDYTGATASDTAVAAAITAMSTHPGILEFGAGTVRLDSTKTLAYPGQAPRGQGVGATIIDYRGTGDCFRVWDSTVATNGLTLPGNSAPMTGMTLYGWNNANTSICGLHIGDLGHIFIDDFYITGFQTAGSKNFWGENRYSWSERAYINLETGWSPDNFLFETNASHPLGHSSWSYSTLKMTASADPNQNGVRLKNNVGMVGVDLALWGNFFPHASANTGVALTIGTTGGDTSLIDGQVVVNAETIGAGSVSHKDINVGAAASLKGSGELVFHDFAAPFVAGTATPTTVKFAGRVDCPSLGRVSGTEVLHATGAVRLGGELQDVNGKKLLDVAAVASAVNYAYLTNSATGNAPVIGAGGSDTNVGLRIFTQGTGLFTLNGAEIPSTATGSAPKLTTARTIDSQSFDGTANITVVAPGTHAATSKTTPVDADELALVDSAASNVLKKLTWANLKAAIKSYYDTVSSTMTNKALTDPKVNSIKDANGNTVLDLGTTASAVNYAYMVNGAAGNGPVLGTGGSDTNVDLRIFTQGTGVVAVNGNPVGVKVAVPATATSAGVMGQWAADSSWLYTCTAANTWRRVAIATW